LKLITVNQEVLDQLIKQIERDRFLVFDSHFIDEILDAIRHPSKKSVDRSLKILPSNIVKEIILRIQQSNFVEDKEYSRKLIAHKYAEDLFNEALKNKNTEGCYSYLKQLSKMLEDKSWVNYLEDPNIHLSDKSKVLKLTGDDQVVLNLVYRLLDEHKTGLIPDILDEYHKMLIGSSIVIRAGVTTAIPIDEKYKDKIAKYLDKIFGKKVFPTFYTDPKIIGGIVIRAGDKVLDYSVRNKLALIAKEMKVI
jgi:F-type H+-transporting ATPase subunit delta